MYSNLVFGLSNNILLCRFCVAQHAYIIHIWWSLFKYNFLHAHAAQSQFLMILSLWWSTLKNLLVDHVLYYIKGNNLDHENRLDIIVFWKCIERSEISLPHSVSFLKLFYQYGSSCLLIVKCEAYQSALYLKIESL